MRTVVITGVGGFVGCALVRAFLSGRDCRVIGISHYGAGFLDSKVLVHPDFSLLNIDLSKGIPDTAVADDVDAVVHLASRQSGAAGTSWDDFYTGNVETTRRVLSFAREKSVRAFVYTSTTAVLSAQMPFSENTPVHPAGYYGLTKYMAERLVEIELQNSKVKGVVLRCPSLVGREHKGGLVHTYYELARQGKDIEIFGEGRRLRNILHVDDLVQAIRKVLISVDQFSGFELFQLGGSDSRTMYDIAHLIKEKTASASLLKPIVKSNPGDGDILLDISRAKASWGFSAMTVEGAIERYLGEVNA